MTDKPEPKVPGAVNVVEGPIGAAHLVDPADIPDGGADLGAFHDVDDITPGDPDADDRDKDHLRGGTGEQGKPTDPATNDDLLGGGAGEA